MSAGSGRQGVAAVAVERASVEADPGPGRCGKAVAAHESTLSAQE